MLVAVALIAVAIAACAPAARPTSVLGPTAGPAPTIGPATAEASVSPTRSESATMDSSRPSPVVGPATPSRTPLAASTAAPTPSPAPASTATAAPRPSPAGATPSPSPTFPPVRPVPAPFEPIPTQAIPEPPERDPFDLARRLGSARTPTADTPGPARLAAEGDHNDLWVLQDGRGGRRVGAVVRRTSAHAVWLFDDAVNVNSSDLDRAVVAFEERIWPRVVGLFGGLGGPGLNGDSRITVFHTGLDEGLAGYYSSSDEYPTHVHPFSNRRKIIYIDTRKLALGSVAYTNVLAHELQHAVHFAADPGEDTWINEGLSELAVVKAGYTPQSPAAYLANTNVQLNNWPDGGNTGPHYGGALLFSEYLTEHYGGDGRIARLVDEQKDGLEGVDAYLSVLGYPERSLDVFRDWVVANYFDEDGTRFGYPSRRLGPPSSRSVTGTETIGGSAAQMGATYYVAAPGVTGFKLSFDGDPTAALLPVEPKSMRACWWGNRGDSIDTSLTRDVDLTAVTRAVLRYSVWYSIEDEWDYAYVTASGDGGTTWAVLEGLHTTQRNANGAAFGPGYTGESNGWVSEQIDLSRFAGRHVLLRFEYVTDDAVHRQGICFDDFEIREIGWFDFAESDRDWKSRGFARASNTIPQSWLVQVARSAPGQPVRAVDIAVGPSGETEYRVDGIGTRETVVVIVSAVSPQAMTPAQYTLAMSPIAAAPGE